MFEPEPLARSNNLVHLKPITVGQCDPSPYTEDVLQQSNVPTTAYASIGGIGRQRSVSSTPNQPRQTRTSKLQASLSSGSADHIGHTNIRTASAIKSTSVTKQYENRAENMGPAHTVANSIVRLWGPNQIVAGSRRPTRTKPGARKSNSQDLQPNMSTPQNHTGSPQYLGETSLNLWNNNKALEQSEISRHFPATQLPTLAVPADQIQGKSGSSISGATTTSSSETKKVSRNEFDIFEEPLDHTALGVVGSMDTAVSTSIQSTSDEDSALQATFSFPRRTSSVKRLSKAAPAYGPTLRLSPSAERYIMGEDGPKKESFLGVNISGRHLRRAVVTKELQKTRRDAARISGQSREHKRPLTSQGLAPQSFSRISFGSGEIRMRKTRYSEIDCSLSADRSQLNLGSKNDNAGGGQNTSTLVYKDPFFDFQSYCGGILDGHSYADVVQEQEQQPESASCLGDDEWSSPTVEHARSVKISNTNPVYLGSDPDKLQEHVTKSAPPVPDHAVERIEGGKLAQLRTTPARAEQPANSNIGSFPPRSSSRAAALDYTANRSARKSGTFQLDMERHVSKEPTDFTLHQKMLGHDIGLASSQLDTEDHLAERGSVAQLSTNLKSGNSKSVLSNVRGFFHMHKRSSEKNEIATSSIKVATKKPKARITANRPFPPIAEIHPLHRPTVSTTNKTSSTRGDVQSLVMTTPVTPMLQSPRPSRISETTALAMQILELARHETSSSRKERLLQLGKIMVDALTQARDAEKAMEEAKQAARKAEVSYLLCARSVSEVVENVQNWRRELQKMF